MEKLGAMHHGLVLVAGMTGSGKSTTVASLIDWINANKSLHILTIEDPVEFVHVNKQSIISQRNVGTDVATFQEGVRTALRHDPDVVFIGEMRDPDTIRAAIDAASTGHLVLTTFHSNTAAEVVNRIVSFFDPVERDLVRLQLRDSLKCVICQRLLPKKGGGRIPALEFLFNDSRMIAESITAGIARAFASACSTRFRNRRFSSEACTSWSSWGRSRWRRRSRTRRRRKFWSKCASALTFRPSLNANSNIVAD